MIPLLKRIFLVSVLALAVAAAFYFDVPHYLTLDMLRENRQTLQGMVAGHTPLAMLTFAILYTAVVALSLPGATIMTVTAGMLFGTIAGAALSVASATLGSTLVFLAARFVMGDLLQRKAGPFIHRLEAGFKANAFSYLLFLRIVPAFPFWVVNLVPAFAGVSLRAFVAATALGIIPGTLIFAIFGHGIGKLFDAEQEVHLEDALDPTLLAALVGLGVLSMIPALIKKKRCGK